MHDLTNLLNELHGHIKELNQELKQDQQHYLDHQLVEVEQSNIKKLTIKNALDALIVDLKQHPQWPQAAKASLWRTIEKDLNINSELMAVNSKLMAKNLSHYDSLFKLFLNQKEESSLIYNNQAQVE